MLKYLTSISMPQALLACAAIYLAVTATGVLQAGLNVASSSRFPFKGPGYTLANHSIFWDHLNRQAARRWDNSPASRAISPARALTAFEFVFDEVLTM